MWLMGPNFASRHLPGGSVEFELLGPWTPDAQAAFWESGADGLVANYARGFVARDLGFLAGLPLRRLDILARTIDDLEPVHELGGTLESLSLVTGSGTRIDLRWFPRLQHLSCHWGQVSDSIQDAEALKSLFVLAYDPEDLTPLAHLRHLETLRMKDRPALRSLEGVERLPWLDTLEVYAAPVSDIGALATLRSPVLRQLALGGCRQIEELGPVAGCEALESLDVSEGGRVESLSPIAGLRQLSRLYLYGSTRITDGDLTPLLGLGHLQVLRIMNRRHYKPSVREVEQQLGLRG